MRLYYILSIYYKTSTTKSSRVGDFVVPSLKSFLFFLFYTEEPMDSMVPEAVEAGDDGGGGKGRLAGLFGVDGGFYGAVADADEEVVRGRGVGIWGLW